MARNTCVRLQGNARCAPPRTWRTRFVFHVLCVGVAAPAQAQVMRPTPRSDTLAVAYGSEKLRHLRAECNDSLAILNLNFTRFDGHPT
jgi:hypothetical protein